MSSKRPLTAKQGDPFLYFSLNASRLDKLRCSSRCVTDDCDTDQEGDEEKSTRFSTEVHLLHGSLLGSLLRDIGVIIARLE